MSNVADIVKLLDKINAQRNFIDSIKERTNSNLEQIQSDLVYKGVALTFSFSNKPDEEYWKVQLEGNTVKILLKDVLAAVESEETAIYPIVLSLIVKALDETHKALTIRPN